VIPEISDRSRRIMDCLARDFPAQAAHLPALLELLDSGVPVPYLVRYRREKIGGMDESAVLDILERRDALTHFETQRQKLGEDLEGRNLLTEEIGKRLARVRTPAALADLACAFRDGTRTEEEKAAEEAFGAFASAIEAGEADLSLEDLAAPFVSEDKGAADAEAATKAAVAVVARRISENPDARTRVRAHLEGAGKLRSKVRPESDPQKKYQVYHDFGQSAKAVPGHRILAVLRGAREKVLDVCLEADRDRGLQILGSVVSVREDHPFKDQLTQAIETAYDAHLVPTLTKDVLAGLKARADRQSVKIFARNLEQMLLFPPAGRTTVLGVEPGVRRGCKIAVLNEDGGLERHASILPFPDEKKEGAEKKRDAAKKTVGDFCRHHKVAFIGVGSGPGCREVERFLRELLSEDDTITAKLVIVNEAGSAAYASSDLAKKEFPKLDPRVRAAVTIARRLQDPMAELVKIKPRSIGVGPYQRDVDQKLLDRSLGAIVECSVNRVGVDLNRADETLLQHVAGLGRKQARAIVERRAEKGPFATRAELCELEEIEDERYRVAAGFLRVADGTNPLDRTSMHPDAYPLVELMAEKLGVEPGELVGNEQALSSLDPQGFVGDTFASETVHEVFRELRAGGGDPRGVFEAPAFREDLKTIDDLTEGMELEGVVTNIASFGAFVDIGVDQEGLVHVSELSDEFIEDAGSAVSVGQRVKVRVIGVDKERKRLSLSRRTPGTRKPRRPSAGGRPAPGGQAGGGDRKPGGRPGARPGGRPGERRGGPGDRGKGRGGPDRKGGKRPGGGRGGPGGKRGDKSRGPRREGFESNRPPRIIEAKAKRAPEPEIDKSLPEDEQYRLKLERLRKKFEKGS
jgi:protein Tex